ncbi:MAG: MFS transporter [Trueperaceae bacterium]
MFRGWWVLASAVTVQSLQATLFFQAYGVYAPFWMAEFGWTRTTVSWIHSLHRTETGLLGPINGWLLQRFGPRRVTTIGVLVLGLGFVALAGTQTTLQFVAVFLVMAVGGSMCGILSLMTAVVNWFDRRRSSALAILNMGISLGGLLVPIVAWGLTRSDWRTVSVLSGVALLVIGLPAARSLIDDPESVGLLPDGDPAEENETKPDGVDRTPTQAAPRPTTAERSAAARAAFRTRAFWLISIGHSSALAIVSAVTVHFVIYVSETLGLSVTLGAALLTLMTACALIGQVSGGVLGDRFDKRLLAGGGMLLHASAMAVLIWASAPAAVVVAAVLHGLGWGVRGPLMGAMRADYFGRAAFAMVMGTSSVIVTVGAVGGPLIVGILTDATGGYALGFATLVVTGVIGAAAFFALPTLRRTAGSSARPVPS